MDNSREFILSAAVRFNKNIIAGFRHKDCYDVIKQIAPNYLFNGADRENQGFLTSFNRFVNRREAFLIAKRQNQIIKNSPLFKASDAELTSEDLY